MSLAAPWRAVRSGWAGFARRVRGDAWSLLELFALRGFAFSQPVLGVMGRSPEFFVFRQAGRSELVLLAVVVVVVPALVLWGAESAAGLLGTRVRRVVHIALRAGLLAIVALQILKTVSPVRGPGLVALSAAVAAGSVVLLVRRSAVRLWLRYLIPAPLVFAALFLAFSPVSDLVLPSRGGAAAVSAANIDTPVVVVFFDELSLASLLDGRGHIDERLFPNFARLAHDSRWFRNATGVSSKTHVAVPAMLSGRFPDEKRASTAANYPNTLFSLVNRSQGVVAFESVTHLCSQNTCQTASSGRKAGVGILVNDAADVWRRMVSPDTDRSDITASLREETAAERRERTLPSPRTRSNKEQEVGEEWLEENKPARFREFVASLDGDRGPTLWFLHLLLPHKPFRYLPSGLRYPARAVKAYKLREEGSWSRTYTKQLHLLQTVYTDSLLGEMLDRLHKTGLYDRSLVVVAADHGMSFDGGPRRELTDANAHHLAWVPFFVKTPNQRSGEVSDRNVQMVDLVPTVADVLGVEVPWKTDGISALGTVRRPDQRKWFFNNVDQVALDGRRFFAKALEGIAESIARPERGPEGLFAVGPFADLVGTRATEHRQDGSVTARAEIDGGLEQFRFVDPSTGQVPVSVAGQIKSAGGLPERFSVAVAVNGTIGGVSEVFPSGDIEQRFFSIVSDSLFVPGENGLDLYLVTRGERGVTLYPVRR